MKASGRSRLMPVAVVVVVSPKTLLLVPPRRAVSSRCALGISCIPMIYF